MQLKSKSCVKITGVEIAGSDLYVQWRNAVDRYQEGTSYVVIYPSCPSVWLADWLLVGEIIR